MQKILFICGSKNQTTMMHAISQHLAGDYDCWFTPYYADGLIQKLAEAGKINFCILGGNFIVQTRRYLSEHNLRVDYCGRHNDYDLILTCSDLIVPHNIRHRRVVLVQEGMTDPENIMYHLVKWLKLPLWLASTSTTGLSDKYEKFFVASNGYRDHFIDKGVKPEKIVVTGIPNFDNIAQYHANKFPYRDYVLVCTSDARETFKRDNRRQFIEESLQIANGRPLIFKLHPNENRTRAKREIQALAPHALVLEKGCAEEMVANCSVLICQYSTLAYVGLALGKEVHSYFDLAELKKLLPMQNSGASARKIATYCQQMLAEAPIKQGALVYG